jgi:hypothetical protein
MNIFLKFLHIQIQCIVRIILAFVKIILGLAREKVNGIFNALKCTFKFVKTHLNVRLNALFQLK